MVVYLCLASSDCIILRVQITKHRTAICAEDTSMQMWSYDMRLCWEVQYNLLKHFIKGCTYNVHCCVFEYSQHLQYLQCLQSQHRTECFNCGARVLFCTGLSPTQFINTSNPLTHHRSLQTATDLKKVQNIPEDFYPVGLWASSYYFSCVQQSRGELSNLNGNEKAWNWEKSYWGKILRPY